MDFLTVAHSNIYSCHGFYLHTLTQNSCREMSETMMDVKSSTADNADVSSAAELHCCHLESSATDSALGKFCCIERIDVELNCSFS